MKVSTGIHIPEKAGGAGEKHVPAGADKSSRLFSGPSIEKQV